MERFHKKIKKTAGHKLLVPSCVGVLVLEELIGNLFVERLTVRIVGYMVFNHEPMHAIGYRKTVIYVAHFVAKSNLWI